MQVLAIDPGNEQSAWCRYDGRKPVEFAKQDNASLLVALRTRPTLELHVAIEYMAPRGMPMSQESMDTQFFAGRCIEAVTRYARWTPINRHEVKLHICGQARAKDSNIRQALIDRWGGKEKAIGRKKNPGPLYGISADVWSALAIAVTWWETKR